MKNNIKPAIVLGAICLVVALIMGVINMITASEIERQLQIKSNAAKVEVLPSAGADSFSENILSQLKANNQDIPKEITAIFKADTGYVFQAKVSGNASGMIIMCGIGNDGKITGVKDIANGETPSFWATVSKLLGGENSSYTGSSTTNLDPQLVSGATKSSTGIYNAVKASVKAFNLISEPIVEEVLHPVPVHKNEALDLANAMYDSSADLESILYGKDKDGEDVRNYHSENIVDVYKNTEDGSFVIYIATRTENKELEAEALVLVDSTGKILKVKILEWIVDEGIAQYNEEYTASFVGKNRYNINDVDLVLGAISPSYTLVSAVKIALFEVTRNIGATEEEIDNYAYRVVPYGETLEKMTLPEDTPETVKSMYKLKSGRGYVFFVSTKTEYARENEAYVYTDINGKILDVEILSWIVGHGVYPTDSYAEGLKGKTIEQLRANGIDGKNDQIDQVAGATRNSANLENAIADALSIVPEHTNYTLIGIVIMSGIVVISVAYAVVIYIKRRVIR